MWSNAWQDEGGSLSPVPGDVLLWLRGARLMQSCPQKAPFQALLRVPCPAQNSNGILLLLLGTVAGAAAENILGGAPSPSITHRLGIHEGSEAINSPWDMPGSQCQGRAWQNLHRHPCVPTAAASRCCRARACCPLPPGARRATLGLSRAEGAALSQAQVSPRHAAACQPASPAGQR